MALTPKVICAFNYREARCWYIFQVIIIVGKRSSLSGSLYKILIRGFFTLSLHQNHQENLLKYRLAGPYPQTLIQ